MPIVGSGPELPGPAYRVRTGDIVVINFAVNLVATNNTAVTVSVKGRMIDDSGNDQEVAFVAPSKTFSGASSGISIGTITSLPMPSSGWLVSLTAQGPPGNGPPNSIWATGYLGTSSDGVNTYQMLFHGPVVGVENEASLGCFVPCTPELWPTFTVQGTVAEDATVGTHVCTLTVSPGGGGTMDFLYGQIIAQGAAGQSFKAYITDGTNVLTTLFSSSTAGTFDIPGAIAAAAGASAGAIFRLSGAMQLVLYAATSTVSDTQTFAAVFRVRPGGYVPSVTFADNTGTPTITINTQAYF